MNREKTLSKTTWLIGIAYIILAILFVMNFITMNDKYKKEELKYITDVEKNIKQILDANHPQMSSELANLRDSLSLELSVGKKGVKVYSSLPYQTNMLGMLNENSILMESQGSYKDFDVWYALVHMPDVVFFQPFFIQQGILIAVMIVLLFVLVHNIRVSMSRPLEKIKVSIEKIKDYNFDGVESGDDVINKEFNKFSKDLDSNLKNVSLRYSELEIELQIERERLRNTMTVSQSFIHDMKSPIHQNLMANELYIKNLLEPDPETVRLSQLNINQNEAMILKINDVLKLMKNDAFADTDSNEVFDVIELFMDSLRSFKTLFKSRGLELNFEADESIVASMNKSAFYLLIHNLLSNMGNYAKTNSDLTIQITQHEDLIKFEFKNLTSKNNLKRMMDTGKIFNNIEGGNKFSGGNGLYLIEDLSKILNGTYLLDVSSGLVSITVEIPTGDCHEEN